ncbi:hypothetical protein F4677DRAFT_28010 [Hypoxylon crocopeplum]|nr:hypothetical protein F4677DRAFT_28010 [Hypoxylon crocopeplum]
MKTSVSLVSILLGICLTGVQAELPYNMPEWRERDVSPPIIPDHAKWEYPHHHTGTGTVPHHPTGIHLPGHHKPPPTGYPKPTGHPYPTGHHHHNPPREIPTFITVTGTGTGTGGHAQPTGHHPWHPHPPNQCRTHADCKHLACAMMLPNQGPECVQGREGKFCACTTHKTP